MNNYSSPYLTQDFPDIDLQDSKLGGEAQPVREVYAAAHVIAGDDYHYVEDQPITKSDVNWKDSLDYRKYLWDLGFGIAEAMDTAQRGSEVDWDIASELLDRTLKAAKGDRNRRVIGGVGADLVENPETCTLNEIINSYVKQAEFIHQRGGAAIIFPNEILPDRYPRPEHYVSLINGIVNEVEGPIYLHWLGKQFNPRMELYWGHSDLWQAANEVVLPLMGRHSQKIKGIKLSTLDQGFEEWLRKKIRKNGQVILTGDDLNFSALIAGKSRYEAVGEWSPVDGISYPLGDYSHALLGIFDGIAPLAARALQYLATGNRGEYLKLMMAGQALSRRVFSVDRPELTRFYKVGLVFLSYINGHQGHFKLLGGLEKRMESQHPEYFREYLEDIFTLAGRVGIIDDTETAYRRLRAVLD